MQNEHQTNLSNNTLRNLLSLSLNGSDYDSYLVRRVNELLDVVISEFNVEDVRLLIGQDIGLEYTVPIAMKFLSEDILAEGDFYEGDLLKATVMCDSNYWKNHPDQFLILSQTIKHN